MIKDFFLFQMTTVFYFFFNRLLSVAINSVCIPIKIIIKICLPCKEIALQIVLLKDFALKERIYINENL